jgi:hypothetical protein
LAQRILNISSARDIDEAPIIRKLVTICEPRLIVELLADALVGLEAVAADQALTSICSKLARKLAATARGIAEPDDVAARLRVLVGRHLELLRAVAS